MPWHGAFNEYPQYMFSWRNKKIISTFQLEKKNALSGATKEGTIVSQKVSLIVLSPLETISIKPYFL